MSVHGPESDRSRRRRSLTLRQQITALALIVALAPTVILGGIILYQVPRDLQASSQDGASDVLHWIAIEIEVSIDQAKTDTLTIAQYPPIQGMARAIHHGGVDPVEFSMASEFAPEIEQMFSDFLRSHRDVFKLRFVDAAGMERVRVSRDHLGIQRTSEGELQDKSHRPYFAHARELEPSGSHVSAISPNLEHGTQLGDLKVFRIATPVHVEGVFAGAVIMSVDPVRMMRRVAQFSSVGSVVLATPTGEYMFHPNDDGERTYTTLHDDWPLLDTAAMSVDADLSHLSVMATESDGRCMLVTAFEPANSEGSPPWIVGLEPHNDQWHAAQSRLASLVFVSGCGLALVAAIFAVFLGRRVTRPLDDVVDAVKRISGGEGGVVVPVRRADEIGALSGAINQMSKEIDRIVDVEERSRRAEEATRAKSEFLANMSHEIRTPITAIVGYADLLSDDETSDDDRLEYTSSIQRSSVHLLGLVNDVLDLSKVEAGKLEIELIGTNAAEITREVGTLLRGQAEEQVTTLELTIDEAIPDAIISDPTRLRQILVNLVGNAVKFTQQGTIRIEVHRADVPELGELRDRIRFDVIDSGIGISPEAVETLFDSFTQADTSTTRQFGGTGLGLAISRRLARLMGGDLTVVDSAPGDGTHFRLDIPCMTLEQFGMSLDDDSSLRDSGAESCDPKDELDGARILLIEDGVDNQRLISTFVRAAGATVDISDNGQIGLDAYAAARGSEMPYDLVISDMQMPVMDGYEAARRIRALGSTTPIIALTAHAMSSDRARCLDAGCDEYLTKPINREEVIRTIGLQLRKARRGDGSARAAA